MNDLPSELRFKPTPLVAITGASLELYQMLEKAISVVTIEAQRSAPIFRFQLLAPKDITIPPRNDKERPVDYTPEGILPTGWFNAILKRIPASFVHVVEWDAADFKTKEYEHCNAIDMLRSVARARNIPVLVLIVKKEPFVPNDEKISAFKKKTQIDTKFIYHFVLNDFAASMTNIENTLKRCCLEFYTDETKHAKKRKEKLSKAHHLKLMVRASYKMGFFSELCNDFASAVKHYSASYTQLRDVKKNWKDFDEIKVVAEVLNFRLCYLHLERNTPSNATTQFHQHVNYYRSLIGDPDREFQHYAWVSRQFLIFGELLQLFSYLAPPPSAPGPQSSLGSSVRSRGLNHPGFYFQAASNYEIQRRAAATKLCVPNRMKEAVQKYLPLVKPFRASVMDFHKNTYVGQKVESSVLDVAKFSQENSSNMTMILEAILNNSTDIAIAQELLVNHSQLIIRLLNTAQDVYRLDHTPNDRTIWHLMSQVAQESFLAGDYAITKANNDVVIPHYRREKWWGLLAMCQKMNFQCSIHLRQWYEAVLTGADLLSPSFPTNVDERKYYLAAISKIIYAHRTENTSRIDITPSNPLQSSSDRIGLGNSAAGTPLSSSGAIVVDRPATPPTSSLSSNAALLSMQPEVNLTEPVVLLQSNPATSLVKCVITFPQQSASINDKVNLQATLTSSFPTPMRFDAFNISFTDDNLNLSLVDNSDSYLKQHIPNFESETAEFSQLTMALSPKQLIELAALPTSLVLLPNKPKTLSLTLSFSHVSKIQCTGAQLIWGTQPRCLTLKWDWTHLHKHSMTASAASGSASASNTHFTPHFHVWDSTQRRMLEQSSIEVLQFKPKLDLELIHAPEALEGEKLPILISIKNGEDAINQGVLRIAPVTTLNSAPSTTTNNGDPTSAPGSGKLANLRNQGSTVSSSALNQVASSPVGLCPFTTASGESSGDILEIKLGKVAANESIDTLVYFVAPRRQRGEELIYKVSYIYDTETYSTTADQTLRLPIRSPFEISFDVYDQDFREVPIAQSNMHRITVGSTFYVRAELNSVYDLTLIGIDLVPVHGEETYKNLTKEANKFAEPTTLHKGDKYSIWFVLKSLLPMNASLGTFSVHWKRCASSHPNQSAETTKSATWHYQGPSITAESVPFCTTFKCDHTATVGKPISHELQITNNTGSVLCLALEVEENAGFAVSGDKKTQYRLNAFANLSIRHTFVPLSVGTQRCPKFHIKQLTSDGAGLGPGGIMEAPFQTLTHTDIFIEPNQQAPLIV